MPTLPLLHKGPEGGLRKTLKYAEGVSELEVTKQVTVGHSKEKQGPIHEPNQFLLTCAATYRSAGCKTEAEGTGVGSLGFPCL